MTRINCVPVEELTGKHLVAEYRELPRISRLARVAFDAPDKYTLGRGHCLFFYDKGRWLARRYRSLVREMKRRGYNPQFTGPYRPHPRGLNKDWEPTPADLAVNRQRIQERLKGEKSV